MSAKAVRANLEAILPLRALYLQETNFQVRYDACHARGWSDSYLLSLDGLSVGYGAVKGLEAREGRDAVFEFFVIRPFRAQASLLFRELLASSGARFIECQSNDLLLSPMLFEYGKSIDANVVLFEDRAVTNLAVEGAAVRPRRDDDEVFAHESEPVGAYVVESGGEVVATGGFLCHYNEPFADLFMETMPGRRRRGFGSLLLQEVKKACYLAGRVPAARCNIENAGSRATLAKAGMGVCGSLLTARVRAGARQA